MCGRSACSLAPDDIQKQTKARSFQDSKKYVPCHNVRPSTRQPILLRDAEGRYLRTMRWGLVRPQIRSPALRGAAAINARAETLSTSTWKRLLRSRRCVVIADGFFEVHVSIPITLLHFQWKRDTTTGKTQPYYIYWPNKQIMVMAGLWDSWSKNEDTEDYGEDDIDESEVFTYTIVTTAASKELEWMHDRMPVILPNEEAIEAWLNCDGDEQKTVEEVYSKKLLPLLSPCLGLKWHAVGAAVNSTKNNTEECVKPLQLAADDKAAITSYFKLKKVETKTEPAPAPAPQADVKHEPDAMDEDNPVPSDATIKLPLKRKSSASPKSKSPEKKRRKT